MHDQTIHTLNALRSKVAMMIPETATEDNIWTYLAWDEDCHKHYEVAKAYGIDLRPLIAPIFSEVVSLLCDGIYIRKGLKWEAVLAGKVPTFCGKTPKDKIISVIDYCIKRNLDS